MNTRLILFPLIWAAVGCTGTASTESNPSTSPPMEEVDLCEAEGWTQRPLVEDGAFGSLRRDLAGDFTVPVAEGDWSFFENFTGCESYVFVPDSLVVSPLNETPLVFRQADLRNLVETGPRNVHYFFATAARTGGAASFVSEMESTIEGALGQLSEEDAAWWQPRLHVIQIRANRLDNWVEDALFGPGLGFGIDRFQRIRGFGNLADVNRFDNALQNAGAWPWESNLAYLKHEVEYYNYRSDLQDRLDAETWTSVYLHVAEDLASSGKTIGDVELPDATTMATFDTLLVDLTHDCDPTREEFGNCDAWDAIQTLYLCDPADPTDCNTLEIARYITTYHREGRWVVDVSPLLPLLRDGGTQRFHLNGPRGGHFVSLRLLLGNTGKDTTPFAIEPLWEGGTFDETYNERHPPISFDVPADATKAELVVVVSGHGFGNTPNCSEFCDHQHSFTVGGGSYLVDHPDIGNTEGCLQQIDQGTVPNQSGTWWFQRSSWCPGKQVDPWVFDITDQVQPGQTATMSYTTNYGTLVYGGGIVMRSWVSFSR